MCLRNSMTNSIIMETPPAEGCGDGGAFHAQFRKAEAAEDEGVVADDIEDIDYDGDHHRVDGLVGTAQGGGEGEG